MSLSNSILSRLQYQHQTIFELTKNFSEEQLKKRVIPDKWSAFENIVHLCAYQPTFFLRMNRIMNENNPLFERYVAEKDGHFYECIEYPLAELFAKLITEREEIFNTLKSLNEEQLNRTGNHPKFGALNVYEWTDFFLLHEAHHLWTIIQLLLSVS